MHNDEIETIQSIKDKTRYYIEQCSPESNIRYTDYFNHTFIPDMVINWNKQERYLYIYEQLQILIGYLRMQNY